jgi:hypothetical protein
LHKRLTAKEVGIGSPLTIVRHTERLELFVVPEELPHRSLTAGG